MKAGYEGKGGKEFVNAKITELEELCKLYHEHHPKPDKYIDEDFKVGKLYALLPKDVAQQLLLEPKEIFGFFNPFAKICTRIG